MQPTAITPSKVSPWRLLLLQMAWRDVIHLQTIARCVWNVFYFLFVFFWKNITGVHVIVSTSSASLRLMPFVLLLLYNSLE